MGGIGSGRHETHKPRAETEIFLDLGAPRLREVLNQPLPATVSTHWTSQLTGAVVARLGLYVGAAQQGQRDLIVHFDEHDLTQRRQSLTLVRVQFGFDHRWVAR